MTVHQEENLTDLINPLSHSPKPHLVHPQEKPSVLGKAAQSMMVPCWTMATPEYPVLRTRSTFRSVMVWIQGTKPRDGNVAFTTEAVCKPI